jgi:MFS transporter, MHS family, citrate/tricarballylate:H+ symporter
MAATGLDEPNAARAVPLSLPIHKVFAVAVGNALEFYDFLTFSIFAVQITHCFFPDEAGGTGLLKTLAFFGAGFITRPIGGIVIGTYGDRAGRRPAMMLSFLLMGIAIFGLVLTPSYAQIGSAAPILLLLFRLLQGFALGGEVGPSTAFLVEAAPVHRRGLYVALQSTTQSVAVAAAGIVGFVLSGSLTPDQLDGWGWRVAFLLGAAIVPVGLIMRRRLPETMGPAERAALPPEQRRISPRLIVLGMLMLVMGTVCSYVLIYMTTFTQHSLHLPPSTAFGVTALIGCTLIFGSLPSGVLSDRIGRKPVMLAAALVLLVATVPVFWAMTASPSTLTLYGGTALLSILLGLTGPTLTTITESLPPAARSGVVAMLYAFTIAIFGGSTQVIIQWLVDRFQNPMVPAWYMAGSVVIGLVAILLVDESAPIKTGKA